jgi:replicative DNA helicase
MSSSFHSEQAVIGALLLDPTTLSRVRPLLPGPYVFLERHHQHIWETAQKLDDAGIPIDIVTMAERLKVDGRLQDVGGATYLAELQSNTPTAANAESYALVVAQEFKRRKVRELLHEHVERLVHDDPAVVIGEIQTALGQLSDCSGLESYSAIDLVDLGFESLRGSERPLVSTGMTSLDESLGGLEAGRLYVVAARPGNGKSALLLSMLHHLAEAQIAVGLCTLEMPAREVFNRLVAHRYGLNLSALTWGRGDILNQLDDAYQRAPMSMMPIYVDDTSVELPTLIARCLDWHHRRCLGAIFIDYLGLVQVKGTAPRHEKVGDCSRAFKRLAKRLSVPVIVACQFNRDSDKDDRRPRLSDLRDSGNVEQDADAVIALHSSSSADGNGRRSIEIGVLKNRSGRTGWLPEAVTFDGKTQRFSTGGFSTQV